MSVWSWHGYYHTRRPPKPSRKTRDALPLIKAAIEAGEDYGACHIVLADVNLEKHHVKWCRERPEITPKGAAAMDAMLAMTLRERAIALCAADGEAFHEWSDAEWAEFYHDDD